MKTSDKKHHQTKFKLKNLTVFDEIINECSTSLHLTILLIDKLLLYFDFS